LQHLVGRRYSGASGGARCLSRERLEQLLDSGRRGEGQGLQQDPRLPGVEESRYGLFGVASTHAPKFADSTAFCDSAAERAAWDYVKEHPIPLVTCCPPLVFGPILHEVAKPEDLNTSVAIFYDVMAGKKTEADLPGGGGGDCIDVRTLADAHVLGLTVPEAAGNRYIISQGASASAVNV
jgi:nucleoside-diphosphate-sugar epimerase